MKQPIDTDITAQEPAEMIDLGGEDVHGRIGFFTATWADAPRFAAIEQHGMEGQPQPDLWQYATATSYILDDAGLDGVSIALKFRTAVEVSWGMGITADRLAVMFLSVRL